MVKPTRLLRSFSALVGGELQPYPGRLQAALRSTLGVLLALVLAETLHVPGISLALALLFLMQRERPGLTLQTAVQIFFGATAGSAAALLWVQLTEGTGEGRFLGVVLGIFISAFCMAASRWPTFWTIFGFYGFVSLSAWDTHRPADALVTATLNNIASLAIVVVSATGVEYAFGTKHPEQELQEEMRRRLRAIGTFYRALADADAVRTRTARRTLIRFAHADLRINELYNRIRDRAQGSQSMPMGLHLRIGLLARVTQHSAHLAAETTSRDEESRSMYQELSDRCAGAEKEGGDHEILQAPATWPDPFREIAEQLRLYATGSLHADPMQAEAEPSPQSRKDSFTAPFFASEAFRSSSTLFYALKLTLAATVCYVIYNALAWPGILTCVVTVLFTGLSSTGLMKQKQIFRFAGASLGGTLGVATVSLLFPNMDSITSLVVVVGAVALLSAWVLQSPTMGYIGVQIGFAFSLVALPGFSAATQIVPARDRLVGIALGILAMWFIFDQLWPVSTAQQLGTVLQSIHASTQRLRDTVIPASPREVSYLRQHVSRELALVQQLETAVHFDTGRTHRRERARCRRLTAQIEDAAAGFYSLVLHRVSPHSKP